MYKRQAMTRASLSPKGMTVMEAGSVISMEAGDAVPPGKMCIRDRPCNARYFVI